MDEETKLLESGQKIYYSKLKAGFVILLFTSIFILQFTYAVFHRKEYFALLSFLYLYYPFHALKFYRYKKPIFIYYNGKLRYTRDKKTYDFENHIFEIEFSDSHNYSGSFIVYDKRKTKLLTENKWYIKNNWELDDIIKKMILLRHLSKKKANFEC